MPIPRLVDSGYLPSGIHSGSLHEVLDRFGTGSRVRQEQGQLLRQVVAAATHYPLIKRVLIWGSFVTNKPEPHDLDYSIVVSKLFEPGAILLENRRFLTPTGARVYYGADTRYLLLADYPLDRYFGDLDFLLSDRDKRQRGIIEISMRGEIGEYQ